MNCERKISDGKTKNFLKSSYDAFSRNSIASKDWNLNYNHKEKNSINSNFIKFAQRGISRMRLCVKNKTRFYSRRRSSACARSSSLLSAPSCAATVPHDHGGNYRLSIFHHSCVSGTVLSSARKCSETTTTTTTMSSRVEHIRDD